MGGARPTWRIGRRPPADPFPTAAGESVMLSRGGVTGPAARHYSDLVGRCPIADRLTGARQGLMRRRLFLSGLWPVGLAGTARARARLVGWGWGRWSGGPRTGVAAWWGRAPSDLLRVASGSASGVVVLLSLLVETSRYCVQYVTRWSLRVPVATDWSNFPPTRPLDFL